MKTRSLPRTALTLALGLSLGLGGCDLEWPFGDGDDDARDDDEEEEVDDEDVKPGRKSKDDRKGKGKGKSKDEDGAADRAAEPDGEDASIAKVVPFLWEVRGKDGSGWLFGTMHAGIEKAELPALVWKSLEAAGTLVMEADIRDVPLVETAKRAMLPPDRSLSGMVSPAVWKELVVMAKGVLPESALDRMKPWFVIAALIGTMVPTKAPMEPAFLELASEADKRLVFLETPTEQIDLFEKVMDVDDLVEMVEERAKGERKLAELRRAYRAGDAAAAERAALDPEELEKEPAKMDALIFARNRAWMRPLVKELARGKVFVAVGLAHLLGPQGLVAALDKEGYEVVRLR